MKSIFLKFTFLFIATSCMCGICSKDDAGSDDTGNTNNTNVEPDLKPDATWIYFDDAPSLVYFYPDNKRPQGQKWVATKITPAYVGLLDSVKNIHFLTWSFENTGNTRFLSNTLNPNGKESMSIFFENFSAVPGPGTYTLDSDFDCLYNVYTSSGALHDSTRTDGLADNLNITNSLNITKMVFFHALGSNIDEYRMSGTATFTIFYWKSGTATTEDIHTLQCTFNNVPIDFAK